MRPVWCESAWRDGRGITAGVRARLRHDGTIDSVETGVPAEDGDTVLRGVVFPAAANAHSHAFHRVLRGRTHAGGPGSFWTWREQMYAAARTLTPELYEELATAVFAEMVVTGWASVAEFHYVHHRGNGTPYGSSAGAAGGAAPNPADVPHAMEFALARAAEAAGIRLTLLDTCYLTGGFGVPLEPAQARFGDGSAAAWLRRHSSLRRALAGRFPESPVVLGAAIHSVRAVPEAALAELAAGLPPETPLHIHLSEQPAENEACLAATGLTPAGLLERHGLLSGRLSAVHATHLTRGDIGLLGGAGATVVMCPTTEADLADGIGPALELQRAGARIALGTDQHAAIDPWLEMRSLEYGERLSSGQRSRFTADDLLAAGSGNGLAAQGRPAAGLEPGQVCDLMAVDPASLRTAGSSPGQLVFSATAADVTDVVIGGLPRARNGRHLRLGDPAALMAAAISHLDAAASGAATQEQQ